MVDTGLIRWVAVENKLVSFQFGDAGLELISEHLNRLQVLNLCETPVTDKGLAYLACKCTILINQLTLNFPRYENVKKIEFKFNPSISSNI